MTSTPITGGTLLFPGLIDCHVHFREPGYEHKATMATEAASARAGGITCVCEMPNTDPPCVTIDALRQKIRIADTITDCDIRFFFGMTDASHIEEFRTAWNEPDLRRRLCGVKLYLDHSTGDQKVDGGIVEEIFRTCAELDAPLVAHCEDSAMNDAAAQFIQKSGARDTIMHDVSLHSLMRPCASEEKAIAYAIDLTKQHGTRFHVAHLSTAAGIDLVRSAKKNGVAVTCEVAPHHLFLTLDDYASLGTLGKMNPPLRTHKDQQALWNGIADGTVDCIATDHAPHTLKEKNAGDPLQAPSGVPGVQTMLPLLLTVAGGGWPHPSSTRPDIRIFGYSDITRLCFENPNRIFALGKKDPAQDSHADRVIIDPTISYVIHAADLHSKCGWTPCGGWNVRGKVVDVR